MKVVTVLSRTCGTFVSLHLSHHTAPSPESRFLAHQEVSAICFMLGSVTHLATERKPLQSPITTPLSLGVAFRFLFTTAKLDKSDNYCAISQIVHPGKQ